MAFMVFSKKLSVVSSAVSSSMTVSITVLSSSAGSAAKELKPTAEVRIERAASAETMCFVFFMIKNSF